MNKSLFIILFCQGFIMSAADPFSFKEINSIENFDLKKPQFLEASDGVQLAYYSFLNSHDKEIVILYPGAGLYGNKTYQWVAKTLKEQYGIGCYIFDIRGHGNSQGQRGDAPSINIVWEDVARAVEFIKKENPNSKIYLVGHSSGAGLIINYAANTEKKIEDGYIFLAPYLGPKSNTARLEQTSRASFIKNVRMWVYIVGSIFPHSFVIHCKAVFFNYPVNIIEQDSLILPFYTYVMSCATTPYKLEPLLKKIDKPVGIFVGQEDEQFLPEKITAYKNLINSHVHAEIVENVAHLSILLSAPKLISEYIKEIDI